jgi:trehalose 6-phosphate phosphatase
VKPLLAPENRPVLAQLAWSNTLHAFDFDGTLAPIVDDRESAVMRAKTRALFTRVCRVYPTAVISGRSQGDVTERLGSAPVKYVVGNHGIEPGRTMKEAERIAARVLGPLEARLLKVPGVDIEDKRYSLAIHYRRSRNKRLARAAILRAIAALPERMRVLAGKQVMNVLPEHAPNKGHALLSLRAAARADVALYVGDDVTDEDVFGIDQPGRLLSVRVGESRVSAAHYYLRKQAEVDRLLAVLAELRENSVKE